MDRVRNVLAGRWQRAFLVTFLLLASSLLIMLIEYAASLILGAPLLVDMANTPTVAIDDVPNASLDALLCVTGAAIAHFLLVSPLEYGVSGWYRSLVNSRGSDSFDVLMFFSSMRRTVAALKLKASIILRCSAWSVVFLAVPTGFMSAAFLLLGERGESLFFKGAVLSSLVLMILAAAMCFWYCQRYALVGYVFALSPEVSVSYAVRRSVTAMRGHRGELFAIKLKLVGYYLAERLVIPAFYAMPMRMTALAVFADDRLKN